MAVAADYQYKSEVVLDGEVQEDYANACSISVYTKDYPDWELYHCIISARRMLSQEEGGNQEKLFSDCFIRNTGEPEIQFW